MQYDHNNKAGNAGDIFKHTALIAALNAMPNTGRSVRFVDLFAGYAVNPILSGNQWQQGIGRIHRECNRTDNEAISCYRDWYLSRPSLVGSVYPGSSLIAQDVITARGQQVALTLYDISAAPIDNLRCVYDGCGHDIHHRAAEIGDTGINNADFLFIDPPGLKSDNQPDYPTLDELLAFTEQAPAAASFFWLPISKTNNAEPEMTTLSARGFSVSAVVWGEHYATGSTIGCVIAYRTSEEGVQQVRDTLGEMFRLTGWEAGRGALVTHH